MRMSEYPPLDKLTGQGGNLFVISGPSGAGKSSISRALVAQDPAVCMSVSATTRPAREGEVHGREYFFVSDEEFDRMIAQGAFLEHAPVFAQRYGTPRDYVEQQLRRGLDVVLEIDVQGARQVRQQMPAAIGVFILPPGMEELERRLRARQTDSEDSIRHRLSIATEELRELPAYKYAVVNDDLTAAIAKVQAIVMAERCRIRQ